MKFVHLAPKSAISRIRRRGLASSGGVCAVPLVQIPYLAPKDSRTPDIADVYPGEPASSSLLWKKILFAPYQKRGRRPIAVIFEPPPSCWPAIANLEVPLRQAGEMLARLRGHRASGVSMTRDDERVIERFIRTETLSCFVPFTISASCSHAMGLALRELLALGEMPFPYWGEFIEVIFPAIPASAIHRLVPLSRTDQKGREAREAMEKREGMTEHDK